MKPQGLNPISCRSFLGANRTIFRRKWTVQRLIFCSCRSSPSTPTPPLSGGSANASSRRHTDKGIADFASDCNPDDVHNLCIDTGGSWNMHPVRNACMQVRLKAQLDDQKLPPLCSHKHPDQFICHEGYKLISSFVMKVLS